MTWLKYSFEINIYSISCECIINRILPWCNQAATHCLNQCCLSHISSVTTCGATRDLWVKWLHSFQWRGAKILTHWGRVTHICVGKLAIIGSDNGLSPERRQAITWTNAGKLLIGPLGTNLSEILIEIDAFSFKKIHLKMSSGKWRPFCLGLNVLTHSPLRDAAVMLTY